MKFGVTVRPTESTGGDYTLRASIAGEGGQSYSDPRFSRPASRHAPERTPAANAPAINAAKAPVRSSNLRLKKSFTDLEADTFLTQAFEYMALFLRPH
jgi:hypothetical protein